ncbi:sensor histidine kinase [Vulgatibacter incomptus]|uniref:histidine kinase n=1 Tax=Vulgatibacter incomptus TaxID=1391653 RepID=A0A0K1PBA4_9BACT|nr:HAMP domain-containing sensor histidine kinase [Vulgatibacter incomptus]AKU90813.1 PAS family protein [Vulgatibacter incomptus]
MRRSPSLRNAYLILGAGFSCLALLLTAALVISVVWLAELSANLRRTIGGDRAAMEIEFQLIRAGRSHQIFRETGDPRWKQDADESEARLVEELDRARSLPKSPEAAEAFARLDATVEALRRNVLDAPPGQGVARRRDFLVADADAKNYLDVIEANADTTLDHAEAWSRIAIILAAFTVLVVFLSLALVTLFARRVIYYPIVRLRHGLEGHARDQSIRVPEAGPIEVQAIGADVNRLFDRLAAQRDHQLTFLASVAHDLRNPMTALRTSAQLAERRAETDGQRRQAERLMRQIDRMNRLVEDLLDVSRIEAGRFELDFATTDLREVVRDTCDLYEEVSEIHEVRCSVPDRPVCVSADATRISQVLGNLVSNAIKYSPEGGPVDVRLMTTDRWAILEVEDRGLGIPEEDRAAVFEAFRRSKAAEEGIPGVGLGLSVALRLVRAHHGEIEVESDVGVGSTFRVRLPLADAEASA